MQKKLANGLEDDMVVAPQTMREQSSSAPVEALFQCVAEATGQLLRGDDWEVALADLLAPVGTAAGVDGVSVYVFGDTHDPKALWARHGSAWARASGDEASGRALGYESSLVAWYPKLAEGNTFSAFLEDSQERGQQGGAAPQIAAVLVSPISVDDTLWGAVLFETGDAEVHWLPRHEAALMILAASIGGAQARLGSRPETTPQPGKADTMVLDRTAPHEATMHEQAARIAHRMKIEGALVEASHLLVSAGDVDFQKILGIIGEAVEADRVYLITVPPDDQPLQEVAAGMSLTVWQKGPGAIDDWWPSSLDAAEPELHFLAQERAGRAPAGAGREGQPAALAVPVLSPQDKLYGYLGFEHGERPQEWLVEDIRVLSVLGDMLSTYFERELVEHALRESEERYRTFVDTISEAIWRIEFSKAMATEASSRSQFQHLKEYGILAECNEVMARLLGSMNPRRLVGQRLTTVLPCLEEQLFEDFVESGYRLRSREYSVHPKKQPSRHFVINAVGTLERGRLVRIWGSSIEVTARVELERRMVGALEEQQQRIGRDLHDGVGQLLTGVRMLSRNLADRYFADEEEGHAQAHKVARFAEEASQRVREIYRGLTPVQLYNEGLAAALEDLAHNTDLLPGIMCSFIHRRKADVREGEAKLHLYRIAQEATNNALKHAHAKNIWIALQRQKNYISLQIKDDGVGFDKRRSNGKSLGLNSMYYRARAIKATLKINSRPGSGTVIRCTLPVDALTLLDAPHSSGDRHDRA